jgi:hypothetical protein
VEDPVKTVLDAFRSDLLALAFLGALMALSFWPPENRRQAAVKVTVGTVISGASAPGLYAVIVWKWPDFPVETAILGMLYFWIGLLGMQLVPLASSILNRLRAAKIPGVNE